MSFHTNGWRTCYLEITLPDGRQAELEIEGRDDEYCLQNVFWDGGGEEEDDNVIEQIAKDYADEIAHSYYCGD